MPLYSQSRLVVRGKLESMRARRSSIVYKLTLARAQVLRSSGENGKVSYELTNERNRHHYSLHRDHSTQHGIELTSPTASRATYHSFRSEQSVAETIDESERSSDQRTSATSTSTPTPPLSTILTSFRAFSSVSARISSSGTRSDFRIQISFASFRHRSGLLRQRQRQSLHHSDMLRV